MISIEKPLFLKLGLIAVGLSSEALSPFADAARLIIDSKEGAAEKGSFASHELMKRAKKDVSTLLKNYRLCKDSKGGWYIQRGNWKAFGFTHVVHAGPGTMGWIEYKLDLENIGVSEGLLDPQAKAVFAKIKDKMDSSPQLIGNEDEQ